MGQADTVANNGTVPVCLEIDGKVVFGGDARVADLERADVSGGVSSNVSTLVALEDGVLPHRITQWEEEPARERIALVLHALLLALLKLGRLLGDFLPSAGLISSLGRGMSKAGESLEGRCGVGKEKGGPN